MGIVGGCIGGWGIGNEGMADRVVRNGSKDGLAASIAFRSIAYPFLYTVKVMLFPSYLDLTNIVISINSSVLCYVSWHSCWS
jgi:hypothetical protein